MSLKEYQRKRKDGTPEPDGVVQEGGGPLRFVVQKHDATRVHFDLRLEMNGVMKSWAVPKGPSLNPTEQRLAVYVEDHPLEYAKFEGIIPEGHYGAGTVMVWDQGTIIERATVDIESQEEQREKGIANLLHGLAIGHITFVASGERMKGEFALIRTHGQSKNWILVKKRDQFSSSKIMSLPETSLVSGRNFEEIARLAPEEGSIWATSKKDLRPLIQVQRSFLKGVDHKKDETIPRKVDLILPCPERQILTEREWLCLPWLEGFRAYLVVDGRSAKLYSRKHLNYGGRFPHIIRAAKSLKGTMVLDGIISLPGKNSNLTALRSWQKDSEGEAPVFYLYDILHLNGKNLRELTLLNRLAELPISTDATIQNTPWIYGDQLIEDRPFDEFANLKELVFRHGDSAYEGGVQTSFLKVPTIEKSESEPSELPESKVELGPGNSPEELLEHWKGYKGSARLTHPDRIYFPNDSYNKAHIAAYYCMVSEFLLPWLKDRPLSLNRHPKGIHGESFFHKDQQGYLPRYVETKNISSSSSGKTLNYLLCQNTETLIYLVNQGSIELNPWFSSWERPDFPMWGVIDLDPNERSFLDVIQVALQVHEILDSLNVPHFCKTSGSKGLHIGIPLGDSLNSYDDIREFCIAVCMVVEHKIPHLATLERSPNKRRGRLYLDCFQNRRSQTLASVYCVRPRDGAPVSTPLLWKELGKGLSIKDFNILTLAERLAKHGDLWSPMATLQADLKEAWELLRKMYSPLVGKVK